MRASAEEPAGLWKGAGGWKREEGGDGEEAEGEDARRRRGGRWIC